MQHALLSQLCTRLNVPYWLHNNLQRADNKDTIVRLLEYFEERTRRRPS